MKFMKTLSIMAVLGALLVACGGITLDNLGDLATKKVSELTAEEKEKLKALATATVDKATGCTFGALVAAKISVAAGADKDAAKKACEDAKKACEDAEATDWDWTCKGDATAGDWAACAKTQQAYADAVKAAAGAFACDSLPEKDAEDWKKLDVKLDAACTDFGKKCAGTE